MATVLITGGTGLIGTALTESLINKGYEVIIVTRNAANGKRTTNNISYAQWDIIKETIDTAAIAKADYIINLAGANVAGKRWTGKRKKEIVDSRTQSAALLVKALKATPNKVQAVISASAIGWYGPDPQIPNPKPFVETDPAGSDFLGSTCQQWEDSIEPVAALGIRLVKLRTGIVLDTNGGAYAEFKKPLKLGVAGILGSGRQIISWIHMADMVELYHYCIENEKMQGVYNAVAPQPVSNKQLILTMAKAKGGLAIPAHAPEAILKMMLGEMSIEVLKSTTVSSRKIEAAGYPFIFPGIEAAVQNLNKKAS